jgi:PKD repeat protein
MRAMWLAVAVAGAGLVTACKDSQKPDDNAAPTADFTAQCSALRCDFHDASTDDAGVVSWSWNFGPGGSSQRNPFYLYSTAGKYDVTLNVTDAEGLTSSKTRSVDPKDPVVTQLSCVDGSAPGGFVACTLKMEQEGGFKIVLNSSSCEAHGNIFRTTIPVGATLTEDGCYEKPGKEIVFSGPFAAGTEISAEVVAPLLANPPRLRVDGAYPVWTLTYEDGADSDFNDMNLTLTALPSGN